jgi:hypothetical protein
MPKASQFFDRFRRYDMAVACVTQIAQVAIKHFETPRRKPRGFVHRDPCQATALLHLGICN